MFVSGRVHAVDGRNPAPPGMYKPFKWWCKLPINWCRISSINSIAGYWLQGKPRSTPLYITYICMFATDVFFDLWRMVKGRFCRWPHLTVVISFGHSFWCMCSGLGLQFFNNLWLFLLEVPTIDDNSTHSKCGPCRHQTINMTPRTLEFVLTTFWSSSCNEHPLFLL